VRAKTLAKAKARAVCVSLTTAEEIRTIGDQVVVVKAAVTAMMEAKLRLKTGLPRILAVEGGLAEEAFVETATGARTTQLQIRTVIGGVECATTVVVITAVVVGAEEVGTHHQRKEGG